MRFIVMGMATKESEAGPPPGPEAFAAMQKFNEELAKNGILLAAEGLAPSSQAVRVEISGEGATVIDGPFAESKELVAGYTLIQVATREEAIEWSRRFPNPSHEQGEAEIEVRQLFDLEDFAAGPAIDRFREMGVGGASRDGGA